MVLHERRFRSQSVMASRSAVDAARAWRGDGGRYHERFDLATLILYFPLVAENLPMLTGAISDFKPTVRHNSQSTISRLGEVFLHDV